MLDTINRMYDRDTKRIIKLSKTNRFVWLLLQLGWLHEGCHYLAARLTGAKVIKITATRTIVKTNSFWQMFLIDLGPVIPGIVVFFPSFVILVITPFTIPWTIIYYILLVFSTIWLTACWGDLQQFWELLRSIEISWK